MIWPFNNPSTDKILKRAAEPLWKVNSPYDWPDPQSIGFCSKHTELSPYREVVECNDCNP